MKKIVAIVALLVAALSLSGCVRAHNTVTVNQDGSGFATMEFELTKTVAEALEELQEMDSGGAQGMELPSFEDFDQAEIEASIAPYGVKLTSFEKIEEAGRQGVKLAFEFKDLKGLSAAMAAAMEGEMGSGMGIFDAGDGNLVLKQTKYDFSDMPKPAAKQEKAEETEEAEDAPPAEPRPEDAQKQMELMGKLMGAMAELDVRVEITVPGDIVTTNAPQQEGRTSIWTINAENMMTQGQEMDPVITFSGKGLKIEPLTE